MVAGKQPDNNTGNKNSNSKNKNLVHSREHNNDSNTIRNYRPAVPFSNIPFTKKIGPELQPRSIEVNSTVKNSSSIRNKNANRGLGPRDPDNEKLLEVTGLVLTKEGAPAEGLKVVAIDNKLGKETTLGEAITDMFGSYSIITYRKESLTDIGGKKVDVKVKVEDLDEKNDPSTKIVYGTSPVYINAEDKARIDVMLNREVTSKTSEFAQITSELRTNLEGLSFEDLREDENRQDISYLANKTGTDARLVAMASLAERYGKETGISADFLYALFRAGLPTDRDELFRTSSNVIRTIWDEAIKKKVIDPSRSSDLKNSLSKFIDYRKINLLAGKDARSLSISTLGEMLGIPLPNRKSQEEFLDLYYDQDSVANMDDFWKKIDYKFGREVSQKLRLNGKLGYLTMNNANLMRKLHDNGIISSSSNHDNDNDNNHIVNNSVADLIRKGYYRKEAWASLIDSSVPIPEDDFEDENDGEKRKDRYVTRMVSLLKKSYPTAVVAEMVKNEEIKLSDESVKEEVQSFLWKVHENYPIGSKSLAKALKENNNISISEKALGQVKRLDRLYKISPSDEIMKALSNDSNNLDSAYKILLQFDQDTFVRDFAEKLGGKENAALVYSKAHQVQSTVVSATMDYLTRNINPIPYAIPKFDATMIWGDGEGNGGADDSGLILQPTMEGLFGSLDYCTCGHCESILSPSAYLVALLQFLNVKNQHENSPLNRLLDRRPDIEHIQLTCENTNTLIPYIDLVNEILEHYVVKGNLIHFEGYNIDDKISSEELLANPQYVNQKAYDILRAALYPLNNLPYDRSLETLRLFFEYMGTMLYHAMEVFRLNDDLEIGGKVGGDNHMEGGAEGEELDNSLTTAPYAWREIHYEFLGISPEEYKILTDSKTIKLSSLFGQTPNMPFVTFDNEFRNAKVLSRKIGISYAELVELLKTQFINPYSHLISKFEALDLDIALIRGYYRGRIPESRFDDLIKEVDPNLYGGDIKGWIRTHYNDITKIIVLKLPAGSGSDTGCAFEQAELRYSLADNEVNHLTEMDYLRILRFIRLWKKIGWKISEIDMAITALIKPEWLSWPASNKEKKVILKLPSDQKAKLDEGFKDFLIKFAWVERIMRRLNLSRDKLPSLLAMWSDIGTRGDDSLYRKLFLSPTMPEIDRAFQEEENGMYLQDPNQKIFNHSVTLQAAFNITAEELALISEDSGIEKGSVLSLENVSRIYRYAFFAKSLLKMSMWEFITLKNLSGIDPFAELEAVRPSTFRFIEIAELIKESDLNIAGLNYILTGKDVTGKASPSRTDMLSLATTLQESMSKVEQEHKIEENPTMDALKSKLGFIYQSDIVNEFIGLLKQEQLYSVDYGHSQDELEPELMNIDSRLSYNHFQKLLYYRGAMTENARNALVTFAGEASPFASAVRKLYKLTHSILERFSELASIYKSYYSDSSPTEGEKIKNILEQLLPELKEKIRRQIVEQILSNSLSVDVAVIKELLENKNVLTSRKHLSEPAIRDILGLSTTGIMAQYFFNDSAFASFPSSSSWPDLTVSLPRGIDFTSNDDASKLPSNPNGSDHINVVWRFFLVAPSTDNYNFYLETDKNTDGGDLRLSIDSQEIELKFEDEGDAGDSSSKRIWYNTQPIELKAGVLYAFWIKASGIKKHAVLMWENKENGKERIPIKHMYSHEHVSDFMRMYSFMLRVIEIVKRTSLDAKELVHFSTNPDFIIEEEEGSEEVLKKEGKSFLNKIPTSPADADENITKELLRMILELLLYAKLKKIFGVKEQEEGEDQSLSAILSDSVLKNEDDRRRIILDVTGWNESIFDKLLKRFRWKSKDLTHLSNIARMNEAYELINRIGIDDISSLLSWVTNKHPKVSGMQNTLKSKYDEQGWLEVIQPINDKLRSKSRDALVPYVLDKMPDSIDTADKLFEYFLIDVQMDPCMKTSRIVQAISTVQLFIQRWILGLEADLTPPTSAEKAQFEGMEKWYRVKEAATKVFLYPENWLDPSLRSTKSSFFKELEGELLQADITEELAEVAILHYLEKLEGIAHLEICDAHIQRERINGENRDILHVISRTSGTSHKYYYSSYKDGIWSPFQKIDLDIDDNPVKLFAWHNRLFLFWLKVMVKADTNNNSGGEGKDDDTKIAEIERRELARPILKDIEVTLLWSEYYGQKWQPSRSTDVNNPEIIFKHSELFDRGQLSLDVDLVASKPNELGLTLGGGEGSTVGKSDGSAIGKMYVTISCTLATGKVVEGSPVYCLLYNTHSTPEISGENPSGGKNIKQSRSVDKFHNSEGIVVLIDAFLPGKGYIIIKDHEILGLIPKIGNRFNLERPHLTNDIINVPFFYQNKRHSFMVKPEEIFQPLTSLETSPIGIESRIMRVDPNRPIIFPPLKAKSPHGKSSSNIVVIRRGKDLLGESVSRKAFRADMPLNEEADTSLLERVISDNRGVSFDNSIIGPLGSNYATIAIDSRSKKRNSSLSREDG